MTSFIKSTLREPVFESFAISLTVCHKCHNEYIYEVSSKIFNIGKTKTL